MHIRFETLNDLASLQSPLAISLLPNQPRHPHLQLSFQALIDHGFLGKLGEAKSLHHFGGHWDPLVVVGLGDKNKQEVDTFRKWAGFAYQNLNNLKLSKAYIWVPEHDLISLEDRLMALAEGLWLSAYRYRKYLTEDKKEAFIKEIILVSDKACQKADNLLQKAHILSEGVCLARDLINEPPMHLNPVTLAKKAEDLAKQHGLSVTILDEKALEKERMGLLLAVGQGSSPLCPPRLVKLHYKPKETPKKRIVLVGKGITFDTGGLDIKTSPFMLDMKTDMSGAAAVLATLCVLAQLKPQVEVIGYLACAENGVGSHSYHPGDILVSRKGLCVEINNTDAEGRLVMADALDYALETDHPQMILDIATLTGACEVALGSDTAGIFCEDPQWVSTLKALGKQKGEDFWQLPLNDNLYDQLKSHVADLKNTGERYGGAITAALFLKKFVDNRAPWMHLDIAGPASTEKDHPYNAKGGVGFGVRTLCEWILSF